MEWTQKFRGVSIIVERNGKHAEEFIILSYIGEGIYFATRKGDTKPKPVYAVYLGAGIIKEAPFVYTQ